MRVRNSSTGTVLSTSDDNAGRLLRQGWENLDADSGETSSPSRSRKTKKTESEE